MTIGKEYKILVVNDLHSGSEDSVMPPDVQMSHNTMRATTVKQSPLQEFMWERWQDMCDMEDFDACFVVGDMIEGTNDKGRGIGNWTNERNIQIDTAVELLQMTGAKEFYGVQGSLYHTKDNLSGDQQVIERLGGQFDEDMFIEIDGVRFYLRHKTGFSSAPHTRSTALNRDMVNAEIQRETVGNIDVHIRAHTHYHHFIGWEGKLGLINPCWKARDAFVRRLNVGGNDLGFSVFYVCDGAYTWDTFSFKIPECYTAGVYTHK